MKMTEKGKEMIGEGDEIVFKTMCLRFDANANEYHFKILEINMPFILKESKKAFKVEKPAMFRATCLYTDDTKHTFTLKGYKSEPSVMDFPEKFLRKSKILHRLFFWRKF